MTDSHVAARQVEPYRALALHDGPLVVDLIKLTLTDACWPAGR